MSLAQQIIQNWDHTFFLFSSDKISVARVTWEFNLVLTLMLLVADSLRELKALFVTPFLYCK